MRKLITQFCNFIFGKHKNNTLPRVWILAVDMIIVIASYLIAILMLYFRDITASGFDWSRIWIVPIAYLIAFLVSRTYDGMLRYSGFNDIRKIFIACTLTLSFLVIGKFEAFGCGTFPSLCDDDLPLPHYDGDNDSHALHNQTIVQ